MRGSFQIKSVDVKTPWFKSTQVKHGVNIKQLGVGFSILLLGIFFYLFFRSAEQTYFLRFLGLNPYRVEFLPSTLVLIGNSLPTFIHVLAFSLLTAGLVARRKRSYALVCLTWFVIDVLFELAQAFGEVIIPVIPEWFSNFLFLENTKNYFLHGRFDYFDLLSIALGSVAANIFLIFDNRREWKRR